jgi:hypothetical protein
MSTLTQPADRSLTAGHRVRAQLIRKVSGYTGLSTTLRRAVSALARAGIPSLVVGGYAVQEHGYARFTSDIAWWCPMLPKPVPSSPSAAFVKTPPPA